MDKLTKEEVLHVAKLARIDVTEDEIDAYAIGLKSLLNEVDKIKDIKGYDHEMLFTPAVDATTPREDKTENRLSFEDVKKNAPKASGVYVEVPVMIHE